jgi:hypothetical protein
MTKKLFIGVFLLICIGAFAQHQWKRTNYRNSTIFSATVWINGQPASQGDVVGAFVNDECRMIANVFLNNDTAYVSSVIHGETTEDIEFRIWEKSENKIHTVPEKTKSKPGDSIFLLKLDVRK